MILLRSQSISYFNIKRKLLSG